MVEQQTAIWVSGPPNDLRQQRVTRAGESVYRARGKFRHQRARSIEPPSSHHALCDRVMRDVQRQLRRFETIGARIQANVLVKARWLGTRPQPDQLFCGFWGLLRSEGKPDSAFGASLPGRIVFRRGVWEDWPVDLPKFRRQDCDDIAFSPYCGTLLHEAVGHAMEDEYLKTSPLTSEIGTQVSHPELTLMDCPDLKGLAGSMAFDDTDQGATRTTLIHRGFLVGDLDHHKGVMRRGSFRDLPHIRASNFVIKEGTTQPESWTQGDLIYVTEIRSGKWLPGTKRIQVMCGPTYLLRNGQPVSRRPWMMMEFDSLDFLSRIKAIGRDATIDPQVHWCVKFNQPVPMSMAGPSILLAGRKD